ncbi:hypothetical protein AB9Q10_00375 [Streptomyces krungchingensis]|uniref:hypothetical protein n=1 Tax=Streptomyces krungchingensis TaxID=1565034 RepID=UPI003CFA4F50
MNEEQPVEQGEYRPGLFARAARGCTAALVFACAVLVVLISFGATIEMESFPGLRENMGPLTVYTLGFAALVTLGGLALSGWRSSAGWAAVACVGALMALRMWTLAPALHCWSYDSVGRNDDGSYNCVNRGDMLP